MTEVIIQPQGIPATATHRHFKNEKGTKSGHYWFWKSKYGTWYWQTNSNNGEEEDEASACEAARREIRGDK